MSPRRATWRGIAEQVQSGRVVESGWHEDPVRANGRYAELERLQADRYQPSP